MKYLLTFAAVCTITGSFAQPAVTFTPTAIEGGKLATGETLPAVTFDVGEVLLFDAAGNELVTVSKPKANSKDQAMTLWDIRHKKAQWTIELDRKAKEVVVTESGIICYDGKRTKCYSKLNGATVWTRKDKLVGVRERSQKVVGQSGDLIDLKTGNRIGSTGIRGEYGVNQAMLDKQTMVVAADGLYGVHLPNGKTWGYESKTGWRYFANLNKEVEASALGFAGASMAFFLLAGGGGFVMPYSGGWDEKGELVSDAGSNIAIDKGVAYYASLENLTAVEIGTGKNIFSTTLPGSKTSRSYISLRDSAVHLVNIGFAATTADKIIMCGHPFVASFNKFTGTQKFIDSIGSPGVLTSFLFNGDTLYANYQHKYMTATDLKTGKRFLTANLNKGGLPTTASFINTHKSYIEQKDGTFKSLVQAHPDVVFIKDKDNVVYAFNLKTGKMEHFQSIIWTVVKDKPFMRSDKSLVMLKDEKNIAIFNLENAVVGSHTAVGINKNSITIADLNVINN